MMEEFRTIVQEGSAQIVIERSQFISYARPISSEEEALDFLREIKKKHKDATHHVPAYILGEGSGIQRCNDDGEPSGTAGVPVLEVLKKEALQELAVVVVRYFGGVKLGAGGLVRAYTKSAKSALEAAGIVSKVLYRAICVTVDYTLLGMMQNQLKVAHYALKDILYDEAVHLLVWVKAGDAAAFSALCIDWTNGRCQITEQELAYRW